MEIRKLIATGAFALFATTAAAQSVDVRFVTATPTVSTSPAYTAADAIGGLMTFTGACLPGTNQVEIRGVTIWDKAGTGADIDLIVFSANPSATTFTDNAALDIADGDLAKIGAVVSITTDSIFADDGISQAKNLSYEIQCNSSNTFYAALIARGTPTYATTSEITVQIEYYTR